MIIIPQLSTIVIAKDNFGASENEKQGEDKAAGKQHRSDGTTGMGTDMR